MGKLLTILGVSEEKQSALNPNIFQAEKALIVLQLVYAKSPESGKKDLLAKAIAESTRLLLSEINNVTIEAPSTEPEPQVEEPTPVGMTQEEIDDLIALLDDTRKNRLGEGLQPEEKIIYQKSIPLMAESGMDSVQIFKRIAGQKLIDSSETEFTGMFNLRTDGTYIEDLLKGMTNDFKNGYYEAGFKYLKFKKGRATVFLDKYGFNLVDPNFMSQGKYKHFVYVSQLGAVLSCQNGIFIEYSGYGGLFTTNIALGEAIFKDLVVNDKFCLSVKDADEYYNGLGGIQTEEALEFLKVEAPETQQPETPEPQPNEEPQNTGMPSLLENWYNGLTKEDKGRIVVEYPSTISVKINLPYSSLSSNDKDVLADVYYAEKLKEEQRKKPTKPAKPSKPSKPAKRSKPQPTATEIPDDENYKVWSQEQLLMKRDEIKEAMDIFDPTDPEYDELDVQLDEINLYID